MRASWISALSLASLVAAPSEAQNTIPIRQLTPPVSTDSGVIANMLGVRHVPSGRVVINDPSRRRILSFDSTLTTFTVIADSTGIPERYGSLAGALYSYSGDSLAFYDQQSGSFIIIDPAGRFSRTIAPPKVERFAASWLSPVNANSGFDSQGRHIYRTQRSVSPSVPTTRPDSGTVISVRRDSAAIVRADPNTRTVDTLGFMGLAVMKTIDTYRPGGMSGFVATNPLPQTDEWALLPDGTIALVRGIDYHIDWVTPDGKTTATPKMQFDWRRVTDEEKRAMLDSAKKAYDTRIANAPPPAARGGGGDMPPRLPVAPREFIGVDPADMPDYYPPIRSNTVRADRDGNVWILPSTSRVASGGLLFDVVNRKGEIFERVQLPPGRNIVAFGPGGIVYMSYARPGNVRLERARIIR